MQDASEREREEDDRIRWFGALFCLIPVLSFLALWIWPGVVLLHWLAAGVLLLAAVTWFSVMSERMRGETSFVIPWRSLVWVLLFGLAGFRFWEWWGVAGVLLVYAGFAIQAGLYDG